MNKRMIYGIVCIVLAAALAFGGIPLLAAKTNAKTNVVKVTSAIPKGAVITAEQVKLEEVGSYGLSADTITKLEDVVGQYAATDLVAAATVLQGNVSKTPISSDAVLSQLPNGKVAISFTVKSLASGLSDKLQAGDIIRIYHFKEASEAVPELQYVKVLAVTDSKGGDIDKTKPVVEEEEEEQLSATVLVQATPAQAKILTQLENDGNIHVALVFRGDAKTADELIAKQDELLSGKTSKEDIHE